MYRQLKKSFVIHGNDDTYYAGAALLQLLLITFFDTVNFIYLGGYFKC